MPNHSCPKCSTSVGSSGEYCTDCQLEKVRKPFNSPAPGGQKGPPGPVDPNPHQRERPACLTVQPAKLLSSGGGTSTPTRTRQREMAALTIRSNLGEVTHRALLDSGCGPATFRFTLLVEGIESDGFCFRVAFADDPTRTEQQVTDLLGVFADFLDDEGGPSVTDRVQRQDARHRTDENRGRS